MKTVQKFSKAYLESCSKFTTVEIVAFLEGFRELHAVKGNENKKEKSKLISIKVPEDLLETFRAKATLENIPYQTQIKRLMREWVKA